jgi:membrane protease YdiL (CAAX protease family)
MHWLEMPQIKWAIPIPLLAAIAPVVWLFFRRTWRQLDEEAFAYRRTLFERGEVDYRPLLALTMAALVLCLQEYYGRGDFYDAFVHHVLDRREKAHPGGWVNLGLYDELYLRTWWASTRVAGYILPLAVWPLFFRGDSLLDFGLRPHGFREHAWIYALCVVVMVPLLLFVSRQPDFGNYYPIYKLAGRSWLDFLLWETMYIAQFLGLEIFFRGWWIRATRVFGVGAIWAMAVPYCMIHFGKPYLEACAAIVAGVVLGSLSMRTRSIYAGFLVHSTVAILNDVLALDRRGALPSLLAPGSSKHIQFLHWRALIWIAWAGAFVVLALKARQWRQQLRARAQAGPEGPA